MAAFTGLSSNATKRGFSTCPSCKTSYPAKKKPKVCGCGTELGGSFKEKQPTDDVSAHCVVVFRYGTDDSAIELLSCRTTGRDTRVFVLYSDRANERLCYQSDCKGVRSSLLASGKIDQFTCRHLMLAKKREQPLYSLSFSEEEVDRFSPDLGIRNRMKQQQRQNMPTVVKVSNKSYAVMGADSATDPMGYVHVAVNDKKKILQCNSAACKGRLDRLKHGGTLSMCLHTHYTLLARQLKEGIYPQASKSNDVVNTPSSEETRNEVKSKAYQLSWEEDLEGITLQRSSTLKVSRYFASLISNHSSSQDHHSESVKNLSSYNIICFFSSR